MARPNIEVVHASDAKAIRRTLRKPQHPFNIHSRPFEITPFLIAPTLPGDTLTNYLMQSRVVSDPILNPLIGWWKEYYYFYVPISALASERADGFGWFQESEIHSMFLDPASTDMASYAAGAVKPEFYEFADGVTYVEACLNAVVGHWFRDEGGDALSTKIDKYPGAYIDRQNGFQSLLGNTTPGDDAELPGVDELEEEVPSPWSTEYAKWEILRDSGLTDVTYEDYIRAQGVSVPRAADTTADGASIVRPELIRYHRKWTYPTNHIDPATGAPTSACSWSIVERGDKHIACKEPGFIFGVTVTRPKMYLGRQKGSLTGLLQDYKGWPSMVLKDHPETSLIKTVDAATDALGGTQGEDWWIDIKDLYIHGEQFVNYVQSVADNHALAFPGDVATGPLTTDRVPDLAAVKSFFVDSGGTKNLIREDGVCHLTFKSKLGRDTTPGGQ